MNLQAYNKKRGVDRDLFLWYDGSCQRSTIESSRKGANKRKGKTMSNISVNSSAISSISYNTDNTLEVNFRSGNSYRYYDVPQSVVEKLLSSDSAGRFFVSNVNGRFRSRRVK